MSLLLLALLADPRAKPDAKALIQAARPIVAAVVAAAGENERRAVPRKGDELTDFYVRAAAAAARRLPAERAAGGFLLGLGVALDRDSLMRNNPLTAVTWRQVEGNDERRKRLRVLGTPTVHGRHDLAQHFGVSAALTALWGARRAEATGLAKEWLDAADGGSGFSFADLAADLAGITFAGRVVDRPARLAALEKGFRVADFTVAPKGLEEGLSQAAFAKRYGSLRDERFKKALAALRKRVQARPGFKEAQRESR